MYLSQIPKTISILFNLEGTAKFLFYAILLGIEGNRKIICIVHSTIMFVLKIHISFNTGSILTNNLSIIWILIYLCIISLVRNTSWMQKAVHIWTETASSVQFSCSVMSDSLWPHELQHARPPFPSPTPGVQSNSHSSSWWCHPAISSSVVPFSSCPQSLPVSESFPMSQLFASGGQSTGVSALASFLPKNTQDWSPLHGLVGFPCSPRDSQESSPTAQFKSIHSLGLSFLYVTTLTSVHDYWKNHSFD